MPHQDPESGERAAARFADSIVGRAVIDKAISYFSATLEGRENIPKEGGALLIREARRMPFWLGEHNLWRLPGLGRVLDFFDAVPGERDAAVSILRRGEILVVYPGGVLDSFKLSTERHKLMWGERAGFAKVAIAAGVPIVPVAAMGVDDMYTVVGREPWIGRSLLGHRKYDLPIAFGRWGTPVPRPVPVTIRALSPVSTAGDPESPEDVERVRSAVFQAIQSTLDQG